MKLLLAAAALVLGLGMKAEVRGTPVASVPLINLVTVTPNPAEVGVPVTFSVDATGGPGLEYQWDFGDGNVRSFSADEATIVHTYLKPGHFLVRINVLESGDPTAATDTVQLLVHHPVTAVKPTNSSTIILDGVRRRVWVVNSDSDTVSSMNADPAHAKDREIPVGKGPRTLAQAADGRIWVVSQQNPVISIINPDTGVLEHVISLPHGSLPYGICMSPDGSAAYVSFQGTGGIAKYSTSNRGLLAQASEPPSARGIAVSSTGRVFVTRFLSPVEPPLTAAGQLNSRGEVVEYDGNLGNPRTIRLRLDPGPDSQANSRGIPNYVSSILITPDGRRAYVPAKKDNIQKGTSTVRDGVTPTQDTAMRTIVSAIDLVNVVNTDSLNERVDLDNSEMAQSACTSPKGDYLFIGIQGTNRVMVRDLYANTTALNGFGTSTTGLSPQGLVFDPVTSRVFVNNFMSRTVTVFDATSILAGAPVFSMPLVATVGVVTTELLTANVLAGKQIFYNSGDTRMSLEGYISCAGCHLDGGSDARVLDFTNRGEGLRNTTMLQGRGGMAHGNVHWSANFNEIQDFANDIFFHFMGSSFTGAAPNAPMAANNAGNVDLDRLALYVGSLTKVARSPFRNADGTLTEAGERGEEIFNARNCGRCHSGRNFSDSQVGTVVAFPPAFPPAAGTVVLHDVGTIKGTSGKRLNGTLQGLDTPTLKGVWQTAPYFHDGSAATLMDVITDSGRITHFGFDPMTALTALERLDLVRYMLEVDELDAPAVNSLTPTPNATIDFVSTGKPYSFGITSAGLPPYIDRSYRIAAPSVILGGLVTIRPSDDDKRVTAAEHLKFTVPPGTFVYIAYDTRGTPPSWLTAGWTQTGAVDRFAGVGAVGMEYWEPIAASSGQVTLGGNLSGGATGALQTYWVILYLPAGPNATVTANEGPLNRDEWANDQDSDGDGVRDEFEAVSGLNPFAIDTAPATNIPDEDKVSGGGTFFTAQPAYAPLGGVSSGSIIGGGGGSGGCGLLGLEYVLPLLAFRLRRRRR